MTSFFLSYARLDQEFALRLADDLIAAGAQIWVDQYDIHPSQHWDRAVETAVRGCQGVIVVLSPRSVASPNVADEVAVAIEDGKTVIPVLMEPCKLPLRMARMQFIDATGNYQTALAKCVTAIAEAGALPEAEATAAPDEAAPRRAVLAPEVLRQAELRLTGVMGPIAGVLVRQAAASATEAQLYETLARSIGLDAERKAFLAWVTEPRPRERRVNPRRSSSQAADAAALFIAPPELERLTAALTRYLGPIAGHVIAREQRAAASREALCQRLADRISDETERAVLLRECERILGLSAGGAL
jgi:hypothetical protein